MERGATVHSARMALLRRPVFGTSQQILNSQDSLALAFTEPLYLDSGRPEAVVDDLAISIHGALMHYAIAFFLPV